MLKIPNSDVETSNILKLLQYVQGIGQFVTVSVMLLERGIRDISRVLVLARNSVYSARSVEGAILQVYKMEGHRSFRENPLILSS